MLHVVKTCQSIFYAHSSIEIRSLSKVIWSDWSISRQTLNAAATDFAWAFLVRSWAWQIKSSTHSPRICRVTPGRVKMIWLNQSGSRFLPLDHISLEQCNIIQPCNHMSMIKVPHNCKSPFYPILSNLFSGFSYVIPLKAPRFTFKLGFPVFPLHQRFSFRDPASSTNGSLSHSKSCAARKTVERSGSKLLGRIPPGNSNSKKA